MATTATSLSDDTTDMPPRRRRWIPLSLRIFVAIRLFALMLSIAGCGPVAAPVAELHPLFRRDDWEVHFDTGIVGKPTDFSPDGRLLAIATTNGEIVLLDVEELTIARRWPSGQKSNPAFPLRVRFSPDGTLLATGGEEPVLIVWNLKTFEKVASADIEGQPCQTIDWSPRGDAIVATVCGYNEAHVWSASDGKLRGTCVGHTDFVESAFYVAAGEMIATCSYDATVRLWDATTFAESGVLTGHPDRLRVLGVGDGGKTIATGGNTTTYRRDSVVLWDVKGQRVLKRFKHNYSIENVQFSPDGQHLMYSDQYEVHLHGLPSGKQELFAEVKGFTYLPEFVASRDKYVAVEDLQHNVAVLKRRSAHSPVKKGSER